MLTRLRNIVAAVVVATCVAAGFAAPAGAASVYWGANIGPHLTGATAPYDMTAADAFEGLAGNKRMSLIEFSLPWAHCHSQPCTFTPFPTAQMEAIRRRGAIPVFGWASYSQPLTMIEPDFTLSKITNGTYDDYIRRWAADAKAWGHPFFLNFNWEMNINGLWPYSESVNGNKQGDFVRAWRHVHDIFRAQGASNVTWVWCAAGEYLGSLPLKGLYPGDEYVDWSCIDAYNWDYKWTSFSEMLGPTYDAMQAIAPTKPLLIGETASTEKGGSKAAWIKDMLSVQIPRNFQNVKGVVWFEKWEDQDWPIESSPTARAAFAEGISSPYYAEGTFGDIIGGPIAPLSPLVSKNGADADAGSGPGDGPTGTDRGRTGSSAKRCIPRRSKTTGRRVLVCKKESVISALSAEGRIRSGLSLPTAVPAANATFRLTLSRTTKVTMRFARRSGKRYRTVPGAFSRRLGRGAQGVLFAGRVSAKRTLKPGRYRVAVTATSAGGKASLTVRDTFTLLP